MFHSPSLCRRPSDVRAPSYWLIVASSDQNQIAYAQKDTSDSPPASGWNPLGGGAVLPSPLVLPAQRERGIVMCVSDRVAPRAIAVLLHLRRALHSTLAVEVAHAGNALSPAFRERFEELSSKEGRVAVRDIQALHSQAVAGGLLGMLASGRLRRVATLPLSTATRLPPA